MRDHGRESVRMRDTTLRKFKPTRRPARQPALPVLWRGLAACASSVHPLFPSPHVMLNPLSHSLSKDLFNTPIHFLLEFIQNADNNAYAPGVEPPLNFMLKKSWMCMDCNEAGFTKENADAIGQSTKKDRMKGFIGEEGNRVQVRLRHC